MEHLLFKVMVPAFVQTPASNVTGSNACPNTCQLYSRKQPLSKHLLVRLMVAAAFDQTSSR
jgi:hypothetical protein